MKTSILEYKGYRGSSAYSKEDECYYGRLLGIDDLVMYEANTEQGLARALADAVEDYLLVCADKGDAPCPPTQQADR
jgi:predicted HicB family RNase H-like nuclease